MNKDFKILCNDLLDKGFRAYYVKDLSILERKLPYLAAKHGVEVSIYNPFKVIFVRDVYIKEDK